MQNTRRCTDVMQMRIRMMKKKTRGKKIPLWLKSSHWGLDCQRESVSTWQEILDSANLTASKWKKTSHGGWTNQVSAGILFIFLTPEKKKTFSKNFLDSAPQSVSFKLCLLLKIVSRQWDEFEYCRFQLKRLTHGYFQGDKHLFISLWLW